jgi:hypothetical protein
MSHFRDLFRALLIKLVQHRVLNTSFTHLQTHWHEFDEQSIGSDRCLLDNKSLWGERWSRSRADVTLSGPKVVPCSTCCSQVLLATERVATTNHRSARLASPSHDIDILNCWLAGLLEAINWAMLIYNWLRDWYDCWSELLIARTSC